jgi:hypothetical protein
VVISSPPLTLAAGSRGPVEVQFEDAYGNLGATFSADQAINLGTTGMDGSFYQSPAGGAPITGVTISSGQDSVTVYYQDTQVGSPTLTISADGLGSSASQSETITPAMASQVVINGAALSLTAGGRGEVTLQFEDAYGNPVAVPAAQMIELSTTSTVGAFYTSSTGGTPVTSITIAAGQESGGFYYEDTQAGTPTLSASDDAFTPAAATQVETISPAAADQFAVSTSFAGADVAGAAGTITVEAEDPFGNTADQYLGTVELSGSDRGMTGLPASYAFTAADAGSHTFTGVILVTAGSQTITATDSATATITGSATVDVVPAAANQVAITSMAMSLVAGDMGQVTLQLEDAYGNPGAVSTSDQTIGLHTDSAAGTFLSSSAGSGPITSITIPTGQSSATISYSDTRAGTPTLTASDGAFSSPAATQVEVVNPSAVTHLVVTTSFPSPDVAGTVGSVTITAMDAYGNTAGSGPDQYLGTVEISSTDNRMTGLPSTYTFTAADAGSHTFTSVVLATVGNRTVSATDSDMSTIAGNAAVTVTAAPASRLVFTTPPPDPITAGQAFSVTVTAEDPYGNQAGSFDGDVTITMPGQGGFTATESAQDGVATFTGLTAGAGAGGNPIQASGGGLPAASTGPVTVSGGSGSTGNGSGSTGNGSGSNAPGNSPASTQVPTIIGEQVVLFQKKNKKGKAVGKPVVEGYKLIYSTAMDGATAGLSSNYELTATSTKHSKKTIPAPTPVGLSAAYDASSNTVTLMLQGNQKFAKGGQLTVIYSPPSGVSSSNNVPLASSDASFTINPKGTGITPG